MFTRTCRSVHADETLVSGRAVDDDDRSSFRECRGVGVRASAADTFAYELVVVPVDVSDTVRSAGGWLCDRVRAGWHVGIVVPEGADLRPLQILGIRTFTADDAFDVLRNASPAALAVAANVVARDFRILKLVERALNRKTIEVTLWGEHVPVGVADRFDAVWHPVTAAARAFKSHALAAADPLRIDTDCVEEFHSFARWYPPDGADLVPVA